MTVAGRVAELVGPRSTAVREVDFPPPDAGRVLVRVSQAGLCASDLPEWEEGPADGRPLRLGHEPVGVVHAVGAGVTAVEPGDVVTGRVEPAFADYVYADPVDLVVVPAGVDPGTLVGEPLGCVVDGFRRAVPSPGARTAVVGIGFMGLVMVQLLAGSLTSSVLAVDPREDARDTARRCGATRALPPDDPALPVGEVDLVVEATGTQPGLDLASTLAAEAGTLSILGYHQAPRTVDMRAWNWKALDVVNAHVRDARRLADSTRAAVHLVAAGRLDVAPLLTHRYPLQRLDDAYEALRTKPSGFVKAVVTLDQRRT